ncbi:hypothetical protein F444_10133 [Phytophthora nicotianae P1976]|uniref:ATP-dependent DNA helicase n=1 Tax=Phytophthora nicotianae P1976 TaxID=1317066 RepID=A0A081A546_PHYNI|nr:hypothetical protein F444_10133 [Phytophthora nicotianae P1976]
MSETPLKIMGGKHTLLFGDWLQLPPVRDTSFWSSINPNGIAGFKVPPVTASATRNAGYAVYSAIDFVVFLTENMRARLDPVYADILSEIR